MTATDRVIEPDMVQFLQCVKRQRQIFWLSPYSPFAYEEANDYRFDEALSKASGHFFTQA